jgi:hypothetical protein
MGLMTLGLLGVMSLFPVGAHFMLQAEIADNGSAIGKSVMSDLVSRGMLNPQQWTSANLTTGIDPTVSYAAVVEQNRANLNSTNTATIKQANSLVGSVVVIDPLGVASYLNSLPFDAAAAPPDPALTDKRWLSNFPGRATFQYIGQKAPTYWAPWKQWAYMGPMRRVTFPSLLMLDANGTHSMIADVQDRATPDDSGARLAAADSLCRIADDLISESAGDDRPAIQWASYSGGQPTVRQSAGDYSWLVTVAPTSNDARNGFSSGAFAYDVSVVVCYKRDFAVQRGSTANWNWSPSESLINAAVKSSGPSGGELLLSEPVGTSALDNLRAGRWIMLCGPAPNSTPIPLPPGTPPGTLIKPHLFFAWYLVQAVDTEIATADKQPNTPQRYVTLRGPEWPWQPAATTGANALPNDLCVGIFPSAVAVHTKTLRLDSGGGKVGPDAAADPVSVLQLY